MNKSILSAAVALMAAAGAAQADTLRFPLGNLNLTNNAADNLVSVPGYTAGGTVRAFNVYGTYTPGDLGSDGSNGLRSTLASGAAGFVTTTARSFGGPGIGGGVYTFGTANQVWNGSNTGASAVATTFGPTLRGIQGDLRRANQVSANNTFTAGLSVNAASGVTATLSSAELVLLTDAITPVAGSLGITSPTTTTRVSGLTGFGTGTTTATGTYRYFQFTFTPATSGLYAAGFTKNLTSGLGDGAIAVYQGAFNPASVLDNCVAIDGDYLGDAGQADGAVAYINMNAGQLYTVVVTTQSAGNLSGGFQAYVAGGAAVIVPAPGAAALLGLGALAARRRRR